MRQLKQFILILLLTSVGLVAFSQDSTKTKPGRQDRKEEKRLRNNAMMKQEEEGVLAYRKHSIFGVELRTNGYGMLYELGRRKSPRVTTTYGLEITEIKNHKEDKLGGDNFFANSFVYGKINNFYQAKLGFGQQFILGQKGNKNGVAVMAHVSGGLSLGLLKPYYLDVLDGVGQSRAVKFESKDSLLFLDYPGSIIGSSGFTKGWNELEIKPGGYIKTSLRFDFGRFNESVQALEIGLSLEGYASKIPIMVYNEPKQLFFQGHIGFVFGRRK